MSGFNNDNTDLTIEASTSAVGRPTNGEGFINLCRNGKLRFLVANGVQPVVRQVGNNVDVSFTYSGGGSSPIQPPQITSVIQTGTNYTITGTGLPGSIITVNGISTPVLPNGTFTLVAPLTPGQNLITQQIPGGTSLNNVIYLIGEGPEPVPTVVVTGLVDNGDGTYTVIGTGPAGETITIGGVEVTIDDSGSFSVPDIALVDGVNLITDADGNTVGSIFIQSTGPGSSVTITSITSNGDGTFTVEGTGPAGETITVGGVEVVVEADGTFSVDDAALTAGLNDITNTDGDTIGSIFFEEGTSTNPVLVTSVVDNGDGTYTVTGTGPADEIITVGGIDVTIEADGTFSVPDATLTTGSNPVTNSDGDTIGSIFVSNNSGATASVTSVVDNGDGTYTIEGTGPAGETITVGGVDVTIGADGTFSVPDATLTVGLNNITDSNGGLIGSIFIQYIGSLPSASVTSVVDNGDGTYTVAGFINANSGSDITIGGGTSTVRDDGTFTIEDAELIDGLNTITMLINDVDTIVGSTFLLLEGGGTSVTITSIADNGDGTYDIAGTTTSGLPITIGGVQAVIEGDGTFTVTDAVLVDGLNNIIVAPSDIVGSIFVQAGSGGASVTITSIADNGDGTFTIEGTGPAGETITVGGVDVVVEADGTFSVDDAALTAGLNNITNSDGGIIGSVFTEVLPMEWLVVINTVVDNGDGTYTVSGTGPAGGIIVIEGADVTVEADGTFSVDDVPLTTGVNIITNALGYNVGSIFLQPSTSSTTPFMVVEGGGNWLATGGAGLAPVGTEYVILDSDGATLATGTYGADGINSTIDVTDVTDGEIVTIEAPVGNEIGTAVVGVDPTAVDIEVDGITGGVIPPEVLAEGVDVVATLPDGATAGQVIVVTVTDGDDNESTFLHPITPMDISNGTATINIPGDNFPGGSYSVQAGIMSVSGNLSSPVTFDTEVQAPMITNVIVGSDLLYGILGVNISGVPDGSYDINGTLTAGGVTANVSTTGVDLDGYALLEITNDVVMSGIEEAGVLTLTLSTDGEDDITIVTNVMVDTVTPSLPIITGGNLNVLTLDLTLSGTADPGTLVVLELPIIVDGQSDLVAADGTWAINISLEDIITLPLPATLYFPLYAIDAAGNRSPTVILNLLDIGA